MTAPSFATEKQLRVTLTLGKPGATFPQTGDNTLIITNLRMTAIVQGVVRFATQVDLKIYGMRQPDMNALTVLFFGPTPSIQLNNTVKVEANGGDGWTQVFFGTIIQGSPGYQDMPGVPFHVMARFGYFEGIAATTALSYPNGVSVATAVQTVANEMNMQFENNGVTASLSSGSYFPGSPWAQLRAICSAADVDYYTGINTISICPKGAPRQNTPIVLLTPQSGLIGYPRIEVGGIGVDCYYNPAIENGGVIQVAGSDLPAANGPWLPYALTHALSTWTPDGRWHSTLHCLWQAA
ncbi:MAG: baseplate hub protein [Steroidobacteraceae bacterium]